MDKLRGEHIARYIYFQMVSEHDHICWGGENAHHMGCRHELEVRGLYASYAPGEPALCDINFRTHCGHTLALMGANGAGKSTLLNVLAGLLRPTQGQVLWNGHPLHDTRHEIAYMPQRNEVDWAFPITVRQLVEMGRFPAIGLWRKPSSHDAQIVDKALESMKLEDLQQRQIGQLSGGQQQRAFLARALAQEAHILLLDEPFTGLDVPGAESLGALLQSLAQEGRLVIASYHDIEHAPMLFDKVLLLKRCMLAYGDTRSVLTPQNITQAYSPSR